MRAVRSSFLFFSSLISPRLHVHRAFLYNADSYLSADDFPESYGPPGIRIPLRSQILAQSPSGAAGPVARGRDLLLLRLVPGRFGRVAAPGARDEEEGPEARRPPQEVRAPAVHGRTSRPALPPVRLRTGADPELAALVPAHAPAVRLAGRPRGRLRGQGIPDAEAWRRGTAAPREVHAQEEVNYGSRRPWPARRGHRGPPSRRC